MKPCELCGLPGERHHIVYRSHGGLDYALNYAYLCPEHHTGIRGVHNDRALDLMLKIRLQRSLEDLFCLPGYQAPEIAELLGKDRRRLGKRLAKVPHRCGIYLREDIIKFLMGGKLYADLGKQPDEKQYTGEGTAEGFTFLGGV